MKKKCLILIILVSLFCLTGCYTAVLDIEEEETSFGTEYRWSYTKPPKMYSYVLICTDWGEQTLIERITPEFESSSEPIVKTTKNAEVKEIIRVGDKIQTICVNGKRYRAF